ncbi:hypothetical protein AAZX31_13G097100 [Glycine max]
MNRGRYDDAVVVLPCELQVEIPPWLPEKTLLRLRCVCKFWKTLVFDPIFVKLHVEGSRRDTTPRYCSMQRLLDDHPSLMDEVGGHGFDQKCHNMVGVKIPKIGTWEAKMGFGYDDSSNTYKVVAAVQYSSMQLKTEPRVYCMGDNCWRNVASWTSFPRIVQGRGWILGGTLNWIGVLNDQYGVFSFDLRKETQIFAATGCS